MVCVYSNVYDDENAPTIDSIQVPGVSSNAKNWYNSSTYIAESSSMRKNKKYKITRAVYVTIYLINGEAQTGRILLHSYSWNGAAFHKLDGRLYFTFSDLTGTTKPTEHKANA